MKDIVERLRQAADYGQEDVDNIIYEAATEIEELRSLIESMRENR